MEKMNAFLKGKINRSCIHYLNERAKYQKRPITLVEIAAIPYRELELSWLNVVSMKELALFQQQLKESLCQSCEGEGEFLITEKITDTDTYRLNRTINKLKTHEVSYIEGCGTCQGRGLINFKGHKGALNGGSLYL